MTDKQLFIHNKLGNIWFTLFGMHIYRKTCMNDALPLPVGVACIPIREEDVIQLMDRFTELQGSKVEGIYLLPDETITLYLSLFEPFSNLKAIWM